MKNFKSLQSVLIFTFLFAGQLAHSAGTPKGQLNFTLQKAGPPISVESLPVAQAYQNLNVALEKSLNNGPLLFKEIQEMDSKISVVSDIIQDTIEKVTDPKNKYDHLYEFEAAPENAWAGYLISYAEGDSEDEEQMYVVLNRGLRDGKPDSKQVTDWTTGMRKAMWHLPRFEGISFRGTRLTTERIAKYYPVGGLAVDEAFISSSIFADVALRFANPNIQGVRQADGKIAVLFVIKGKTGRPVSAFALHHAHEQEILFANGTPMLVTGKSPVFTDPVYGDTQIIVLQEK